MVLYLQSSKLLFYYLVYLLFQKRRNLTFVNVYVRVGVFADGERRPFGAWPGWGQIRKTAVVTAIGIRKNSHPVEVCVGGSGKIVFFFYFFDHPPTLEVVPNLIFINQSCCLSNTIGYFHIE